MLKIILGIVVALLAYLLLWPVPIDPQAWQAPAAKGYVGNFAVNDKLENFQRIEVAGLHGPEAAVASANGDLYATTHEGWIVRWVNGSGNAEKWVNLGGRPLGLAFDAQGNLWVANAYLGLQKISPQKLVTTEVTEVAGVAVRYADDLDIAPNGKILFSDASTKFAAEDWQSTLGASLLDLMEHGLHGRIIEYDPATKQSKVVMDQLSFANGVAIDPAGEFALIAETGAYRVWKYWLSGSKEGQSEVLIDNLPGFPDNVHNGQDGRYWVGLTSPRSKALDDLSEKPFVRKIVQRLPASMRPKVENYGMVLAIDANGKVLANLQAPSGKVYATTGVAETDNSIYVTSLTAPFLAKYSKAELGL
ncbi:MAG: sugar lactone lactonase YvrE [Pseudoalteromonas tetraodonis]|jgi:sugar lactone lactonase YvrE